MKVYTKTGDKGKTSLIGGARVLKHHVRIEAYGTVDELISHVGLLRDQPIDSYTQKVLIDIQDRLMTCASILATDCENCEFKLPSLYEEDIIVLEKEIDRMEENLPPLTSFVLPGGHPVVSLCHIARNVCRRAERNTIKLSEEFFVPDIAQKYLDRLSDFLFVLSRKLSIDFKAIEIQWKPKL